MAITLSVGYAATSPKGRGLFVNSIITQIGRENNVSAEICKQPYEKRPTLRPFFYLYLFNINW